MLDSYLDLCYNLKINIFAYDYSGYGISTGVHSDFNLISDIKAVYEFVRRNLNYSWNKIVLYG